MPDDPIRPELRGLMNDIGKAIGQSLPDGCGFALLVFNFGEGGFMNYISNADREDMAKAMREFLARWEREGE